MPDNQTETKPDAGKAEGGSGEGMTFEAFLAAQPAEVKSLYEQHISGLQNTVKATRGERDALQRELRELSQKAEKGSEAEKRLAEIADRLAATERRAAFAEQAIRPDVGCTNPKAAYALAAADGLWLKDGAPDWNAIKAAAPELFTRPRPADAGAGAGTTQKPPSSSMNDLIRRAAGGA